MIIWLGNESNAAVKAFRYLAWISTKLHSPERHQTAVNWGSEGLTFDISTFSEMCGRISSKQLDHYLEGVAKILCNPYWSRIWVLQEVVLARAATVVCGSLSMEWNQFSLCVEETCLFCQNTFQDTSFTDHIRTLTSGSEGSWSRLGTEGIIVCPPDQTGEDIRTNQTQSLIPRFLPRQMLNIKTIRAKRIKNYPLKMSTLLQATVDHKSTDLRDKVYALLGMADMSDFNTPIIADYTKSYPKVCTQLAVQFLLSRMDLAILEDLDDPVARYIQGVPPRHTHLPSWVPDFGNACSLKSLDRQNWKLTEDSMFHQSRIDNKANELDSDASRRRAFNASAHPRSQFPYTFSADLKICTVTGIEFDTVKRRSWLFQDGSNESRRTCLRQWQRLVETILHDEYPRGGTYKEAYWRTTFCNIYWPDSNTNPFWELPSVIYDNFQIPPTSEGEEQRLIDLVCSWSTQATTQMNFRTIFLSHSGLLGLGPASMLPGDTLAVLMGGRVPIVLRQSNDRFQHDKTKSGIYHRVIGER